jgi:hypothetical protein
VGIIIKVINKEMLISLFNSIINSLKVIKLYKKCTFKPKIILILKIIKIY